MAEMVDTRFGRRTISDRDLEMRRFCCGLAGLCDLFLKRRPPNDCSGYQPPVWSKFPWKPRGGLHVNLRPSAAWAWGDPHITTLDGHSYTFNGYGEFVMLRYGTSVEFQARMRPTPNTSATQFSAFSFGYIDGSRVMVRF